MKTTLREFTVHCICYCIFGLLIGYAPQVKAQTTANFVASAVHICQGDTVQFTNLSTGAFVYQWAENGVPFSSQVSPSRVFNFPGVFVISLVANNGGLVSDTTSTLIQVNPSLGSSIVGTDASCNGFSDGSADLTPVGGTPNLSLCFDGVDDFINADSVTRSNFSGGITVEGWIRPNTVWNSNDGMVVAFNTATGANNFLISYNRNLQKFIYFDDVVGNQLQNGTSPLGQWAHLAVTITGSNQGTMFVNGVPVENFTTGITWIPNNGRCSIGQEYDGFATSQHFNGCMDEVRIWNTALTQTTIQDNFNNSCGSIDPNHPNINNLIAYYSFNEGSGTITYDRSGNDNHGIYNGNTWGPPIGNNYGCFSAGTGFAYNWSNGGSMEDQSGLSAGTYAVTITDGAGCVREDSVVIGEPGPLVYSINTSPSDTLCLGDTVNLSLTGGYTFTYTPSTGLSASSGATLSAFPDSTTTYEVIAEDSTACRDTSNFTLTVNPLPTPGITGVDTLCLGDMTTLVATGGVLYNWNTGDMTATLVTMPTADSLYTVTVTDANGCEADTQYNVTVNPLPQVAFAGDQEICFGDSTSLTASGGIDYSWSTGDMTATIQVAPPVDTSYSVLVTDSNGCQSTDSVPVTVNLLPVVSITGDAVICDGDTATLTASGAQLYVWDTNDSTATIQVSPSMGTTYMVVATDSNTCINSDSFQVGVNSLPMVTAGVPGPTFTCAGDSLSFTATGALSYVWSTGDSTATINVAPSDTTLYTVIGTDSNGCSSIGITEVIPRPLPMVSIAGDTSICLGDSTTLIASGADTYSWDTGDSTDLIQISPSVTTTYMVTGTDSNGCTNTSTASVIPNALPLVTIAGDSAICAGDTATLMASGADMYSWDTGDSTDLIQVSPTVTTTYMVTGTDSNGCTNTSTASVISNAIPVISIAGDTAICVGETATLIASGANTYSWDTGDSTDMIQVSPTVTTTYMVSSTDSNGCTGSSSASLAVNALPAQPTIIPIGNILDGGPGYATYQWFFNGSPIAGATMQFYTATQDGDYSVTVTNASGCENNATIQDFTLVSIDLSSAFTTLKVFPNPNQGRFTLQVALENPRELELKMVNLVGQQVYQYNAGIITGLWSHEVVVDGLAAGVYIMEIKAGESRSLQRIVID